MSGVKFRPFGDKYRAYRLIVPRFWSSKIERIRDISSIERLSDHSVSGILDHDVLGLVNV